MNMLVLNCGSSSLKYKVVSLPDGSELVRGEAERVGIKTQGKTRIIHSVLGEERAVEAPLPDHSVALQEVLGLIAEDSKANKDIHFEAFAHRYVHPGTFFAKPVTVSRAVLAKLKKTFPLAPIHNPISYRLIEFCHKQYPEVRQFVVFDTSFHRTIPPSFSAYAINRKVAAKYGIKKVGFHGISHRYVMEEAGKFLGKDPRLLRIISCHLGTGGASVCAIKGGRSINSSMGFTPLEGLMMNTRCGDVDSGALLNLMFREKLSSEDAEKVLNNKSGVLGIYSASSDLRDVIRGMNTDKRAKMTFEMYARRVRTYVCFYALILKKADVLIFTDSLGMVSPILRQSVCGGMELIGVSLDKDKNEKYAKGISDISSELSETRVLIVPTDEEIMIAREAYKEFIKHDTGS
ncbi:MAG: acetate/propionate family kinase [Candidatus Omnitrophota bacterium]